MDHHLSQDAIANGHGAVVGLMLHWRSQAQYGSGRRQHDIDSGCAAGSRMAFCVFVCHLFQPLFNPQTKSFLLDVSEDIGVLTPSTIQ